jgi:hypothetical protein
MLIFTDALLICRAQRRLRKVYWLGLFFGLWRVTRNATVVRAPIFILLTQPTPREKSKRDSRRGKWNAEFDEIPGLRQWRSIRHKVDAVLDNEATTWSPRNRKHRRAANKVNASAVVAITRSGKESGHWEDEDRRGAEP